MGDISLKTTVVTRVSSIVEGVVLGAWCGDDDFRLIVVLSPKIGLLFSINCSSSSMDGVTLLTPAVFSNK